MRSVSHRRIRQVLTVGVAAGLALATSQALAQGSGVQLTPDSNRYLISKDVGAERWAISYNVSDDTITGNVFKTDGSPPSFIWCRITDRTTAPNPEDNQYTLDCFGADACAQAPCSDDDWTLIASGLTLGGDFLLPDGTSSTLSGNVQPIFTQSCATSIACHQQGGAGGVDLVAGLARDATFRVPSSQVPALFLVDPFTPDASYLFDKVTGDGVSTQMPLGGPFLAQEQIDAIRNWILEGAVDN